MRAQRAQPCRDLDQWVEGGRCPKLISVEGVVRGSGYCLYRYCGIVKVRLGLRCIWLEAYS